MASCSFEKLEVYQLAERLADDVWRVVLIWPKLAQDTVGKQLIRACDRIGANTAEGSGKGTFADNRRYVRTARGSLYESRHWLRRAFPRDLLSPQEVDHFRSLLQELGPRLNAYLRSIGRQGRTNGSVLPTPTDEPTATTDDGPMTSDQ
jgi:four helix bundle protein